MSRFTKSNFFRVCMVFGLLLFSMMSFLATIRAEEGIGAPPPDDVPLGSVDVTPAKTLDAVVGGPVCPVTTVVTNTFSGATTQQGRIFRDGIASTCSPEAYPGIFNVGTTYNYEIHNYANLGTADSCVVVNFDPNSGGTPCATNAHASAYINSYEPLTQSLNYLGDVGSSATQPFSFTVPAGENFLLVVTNTSAQAVCDYSFSIAEVACQTSTDLEITKLAPSLAALGDTITYTITALNTGLGLMDATNVLISDTLPAGTSYVGSTATSGSYDDATGVWSVPNVAVSSSETLMIEVQTTNLGIITNTATLATADQPDLNASNNSSSASTTVTGPVLDIAVNKVGPYVAVLGDTITYTITASQIGAGSLDATNVVISDTLPAGTAYVGFTASAGSYDDATGIWSVPTIVAQTTETLTIQVETLTTGFITNTVSFISADDPDVDASNDTDFVVTSVSEALEAGVCPVTTVISDTFTISNTTQFGRIFRDGIPSTCDGKAYPSLFNAGTEYNYNTYTFGNPGSYSSCVAIAFDPNSGALPCGTNAHASAYLNSYDPNNQSLNYMGDVGSSITQPFSFTVPAGQNFIVQVSNTSGVAMCDYSFSVAQVACQTSTDVAVNKFAPSLAYAGQVMSYTITAANTGLGLLDATSVVISDPLPANMSYVGSSASSGTYDDATGEWAIPSLTVNTTATLTIQVEPTDTGAITNTVSFTSAAEPDLDVANNTASVMTWVKWLQVYLPLILRP